MLFSDAMVVLIYLLVVCMFSVPRVCPNWKPISASYLPIDRVLRGFGFLLIRKKEEFIPDGSNALWLMEFLKFFGDLIPFECLFSLPAKARTFCLAVSWASGLPLASPIACVL